MTRSARSASGWVKALVWALMVLQLVLVNGIGAMDGANRVQDVVAAGVSASVSRADDTMITRRELSGGVPTGHPTRQPT